MQKFGQFYLDKEKDIIVELYKEDARLSYILRTPYHKTGNLITNLAALCKLPISFDDSGLKVIRGEIPCYVDGDNREVYAFRLNDTKVANIYPNGDIERKAYVPAIAKTLMSQTKDYHLDFKKTLVKTYIRREHKFRTDLHTHMNANLDADILIALGIHHQIRYPLYYIKKLGLIVSPAQQKKLDEDRSEVEKRFKDSPLQGKYKVRRIDDNTFINFADFILNNLENADHNLPRIRASLTILKDGQAVFSNLEKVYLYRYVFAKGIESEEKIPLTNYAEIPDREIVGALRQMEADRLDPRFAGYTLYQNKLLWIARGCKKRGIVYAEISDTSLVKPLDAPAVLAYLHASMPDITAETGVILRFLASFRRIPLTIVKDHVESQQVLRDQLRTLRQIAVDPYVAGSDIIGEEINDIRDLKPVLTELVRIAAENPGFVIRIHAGENDGLRDNVEKSVQCVREALLPGQKMPRVRIGHGLYTPNLKTERGKELLQILRSERVVLEFQLTSNVRLNNLSTLKHHPLKQYLKENILCVQGTDGGAIYGTDSIDEQLALEKMLELTYDELLEMKKAEELVLKDSLEVFEEKKKNFSRINGGEDVRAFYERRIREEKGPEGSFLTPPGKVESAEVLSDRIREMPCDGLPVVLLGGSFNNDHHHTRVKEGFRRFIDELAEKADPEKVFFVIGHRLSGYERELVEKANGRFRIFAIVPTQITPAEARRLRRYDLGIRISIEPTGMGLYKSFSYEIFKRRPSVVLAIDGNSAAINVVQEARNGKKKAQIFVSAHAGLLTSKARMLEGYARLIDGSESVGIISGINGTASRTL